MINLLKLFTVLRKTVYLIDYWFVIKSYMTQGRYGGKKHGASNAPPGVPPSQKFYMFTNQKAIQILSFKFYGSFIIAGTID